MHNEKPVLFIDFDGTLCHDRFWRSADTRHVAQIQQLLFSKDKSIIRDWMRGRYSSEEINQLIARQLNIQFAPLWDLFVKDCEQMKISRATLDRIRELSARYTTILTTDNMDCFTRFTVPAQHLDLYFDHIINSSETTQFKEDNGGELFAQLAAKNHSQIKNCILMDNSKSTCAAFSVLGGTARLVTHERSLDYWLANTL